MSGTHRPSGPKKRAATAKGKAATGKKAAASKKPAGKAAPGKATPGKKRNLLKQVFAIGQPNDWRTWLQRLLVVCIIFVLVLVGAFFVAYQATSIPDPNAAFQSQTSYVYYADGKTPIGTYATQNRQTVPLNRVSQTMQDATVAAEDRTFWTNTGVDLKSIVRSVFSTASGNTQGGSTITMQYVKVLYLNQAQTISRKIKQVFLALKIQKQESKAQILEGYLNTIYFGRGAYGVQAAAQAYFGIGADKLNVRQSAMLAAIINQPSYLKPDDPKSREYSALLGRYQYVLKGMISMGKLDASRYDKLSKKLPKTRKQGTTNVFGGQKGFEMDMVKKELTALGFTEEQIYGSGLRVTTTLTTQAMKAAHDGVQANVPSGVSYLHAATASVDVKTGALLGFYAGQDFLKSQYNWATAPNPPGSVFKVPALAMALSNGWSLMNTFNGNSPLSIGGGQSIGNEADAAGQPSSYGTVTLLKALEQSINTAFVDMTLATKKGAEKIKDMALAMGVPANAPGLTYKGSAGEDIAPATISLGSLSVSPVDIANTYATVANAGMAHPWYMIQKVTDSTGKVLWTHQDKQTRAMSAEVAADVSYAMQQVVAAGTGGNARALGRSDAGKTGTATGLNNTHVITSWFAGFTPQVSTAVIYLRTNPKSGAYLPLDGAMPSYFGADYPTRTWTSVMRGVLEGMPVLSFPPKGNVAATQKDSRHGIYSPPPTSSAPPKKPKPQKSKTPKAPQSSTTDPSPSTPEETNPTPPEPSATCTAILNGATYPCNTQ